MKASLPNFPLLTLREPNLKAEAIAPAYLYRFNALAGIYSFAAKSLSTDKVCWLTAWYR